MPTDFGSKVSRTLSALLRNYQNVIFQEGKPPLDSEINLLSQIQVEGLRQQVKSLMHSGFVFNPTTGLEDYEFDSQNSNQFVFGRQLSGETEPSVFANVNGWLVPVAGVNFNGTKNLVKLYPPPSTGTRTDLVFLEVWRSQIAPNPSTVNKPTASEVYTFGNVQYGGTNTTDDLLDPTINFETTERVQLQYRIRVYGQGLVGADLGTYPDGLGDPNVLGQGNASSPVGGFAFQNMRTTEGDPSLWRAGDGIPSNNLDTIDGYVYAIPICAIFRRNNATYTSVLTAGNPNQNGAFERTPSISGLADPLTGAKTLTTLTLNQDLDFSTTGVVNVTGLVDSGLDDPNHTLANVFLRIGDEIVGISAIDTGASTITIATRGRYGTNATQHLSGDVIGFFNSRPDNLFADQIAEEDILDLRRAVSPDWDYQTLLIQNLNSLFQNKLRSDAKQSASGSTQGVTVVEVDSLYADGGTAVPNETEALDGPDGIRTIFSDAATLQHDVTVLCDNDAALTNGFTTSQFDATVTWDVGADFRPTGFINNEGSTGQFRDGSVIFLHIGGQTGGEGARSTFRDGNTRAVRFVSPKEYFKGFIDFPREKQYPQTVRFLGENRCNPISPGQAVGPDQQAGPLFPFSNKRFSTFGPDFVYPFIFLGGLLNPSLQVSGIDPAADLTNGPPVEVDLGLDFDNPGDFFSLDTNGDFANDPTQVAFPFFQGNETLYGMITNNGMDITGYSSEVFLVLYGDDQAGARGNNGVFQVIGAGTAGYTNQDASNATSVVVVPICSQGISLGFNTGSAGSLTGELRSMRTHVEDGAGSTTGPAAAMIVFTDLAGTRTDHPWTSLTNGDTQASKMVINSTLLYSPGRSGTARLPDSFLSVSIKNPGSTYLQQSPGVIDAPFVAATGVETNEYHWEPNHISTWNRLPSKGVGELYAAGSYPESHGGRVVSFSEQDREAELFVDKGSKTFLFRPFQNREMTLQNHLVAGDPPVPSMIGSLTYGAGSPLVGSPKDAAGMFTANKVNAFPVPPEYMPRFGRQDIPYYEDIAGPLGSGAFLDGINHLFRDDTDPDRSQFFIVGGEDNTSGGSSVLPIHFQTGSGGLYGSFGTTIGAVLSTPTYEARRTSTIGTGTPEATEITNALNSVISSDLGRGLKGIQLPPYLGVARVYGVYDRADYIAQGGQTFQADRVTPQVGTPVNLLNKSAKKQTLFILQDGAKDLTLEDGDHTYIIPEQAIDVTKSPNWSAGLGFDDFEYVVECVVFGFAKNWINQNNYVLVRAHAGDGTALTDAGSYELESCEMVIPSAALLNDLMFAAYKRTVYQGDPYGTRAGTTYTATDYEQRYGQLSEANAALVRTPLPKDPSEIQTPNLRKFEVLASVNFYTTQGTGNIGGEIFPGTVLDVGNVRENEDRLTGSVFEQVDTRAFTEIDFVRGTRARAEVQFLLNSDTTSFSPPSLDGIQIRIKSNPASGLGGIDETLTGYLASNGSYTAASDEFLIGEPLRVTANLDFPSIAADSFQDLTTTVDGIRSGAVVVVNQPSGLDAGLVATAFCEADDTVTVRVQNTTGGAIDPAALDFDIKIVDDGRNVSDYSSINQADAAIITARNLARAINSVSVLGTSLIATPRGSITDIEVITPGEVGNLYTIELILPSASVFPGDQIRLNSPGLNTQLFGVSKINFGGGKDFATNAGDGNSSLFLTGATERLPMGILAQDYDFMSENVLKDKSSSLRVFGLGSRSINRSLPLSSTGEELDRFLDTPGTVIAMSDGEILKYDAFNSATNPTGTQKYRIYRGGGAVFILSGENPGGPVDWVAESLAETLDPVLKSGVLAGKALLVKNFPEEAFTPSRTVSEGDELQLILLTTAVFGDGNTPENGLNIQGIISPTGYGEGYSAADRYRLSGKPMEKRFTREGRDPSTVDPAIFTEDENGPLE